MKRSKKYFKILCIIMLFALILTACGQKAEDSSGSRKQLGQPETTASASAEESGKEEGGEAEETAAGDEKAPPIKILYSSGLCGIPIHIAKQLQFLEAEGLVEGVDYEYVTSSTPGVEMLSTGQADISFGMLSSFLAPLDNGLEAKTVLGVHTGCLQIIGRKDEGIDSVEDLKGKKIGVENLASSAHTVAQRALESVGIGTTTTDLEVEFVVIQKDNLPIALQNGEVDAVVLGDPKATILVNEGTGVSIFNSATSDLLKDEYCCALWVRNEVLEKYPEQVAKAVRAIQKASTWVSQNVELAAEIQLDNEWLVGDLDIDIATISQFKYLTSVSQVKEGLVRNIVDMKDLGLIRPDTDTAKLAENSFFALEGVPDEITETVEPPIDPKTQIK